MLNGITLMHEHTKIDLSRIKNDLDTRLDVIDETIKEFKELYKFGVRNILDVTNIGMGRDFDYIKRVSDESGINIILCTGFYKTPFLPEYFPEKSVEDIANIMIDEIENGIDEKGIKASVIGEVGTSKNEWTEDEKKLFEATVLAHKKTGALITTHTSIGTLGMEQVEFFKEREVDLSRVIIGHQDLNEDKEEVIQILKSGASVGFDTIGKNNYMKDIDKIDLLLKIQNQNLIDGVVLSLDITRKSHMKNKGGIGYAYLFETFLPMAKEKGLTDESIKKMLVDNPKRLLKGVIN